MLSSLAPRWLMVRSVLSQIPYKCSTIATDTINKLGSGSCSHSYRSHLCGELTESNLGETVTLCGWTRKKRLLGEGIDIAFVPLGDHSGTVQLTCDSGKWANLIESLRTETVVMARGVVKARPEKDRNSSMHTGGVEVEVESLEVLNEISPKLPFLPSTKGLVVTEELRLRERQLELRTPHTQRNLRLRSEVAMAMREYLAHEHGFVEVETPTLFKRTSEGSREFIVPTRKPGKFYSLAQSPQQFKQLLMVGGIDRYFQFARCYRDEDMRSDRQPEFTQVDLEMSFVDMEGVIGMIEGLLSTTLTQLTPHLHIPPTPFPRMTYNTAMEKYKSDKPDTREDRSDSSTLNFLWVVDFPLFTRNKDTHKLESTHHPFTAPHPDHQQLIYSSDQSKLENIRSLHYDLVVNGVELGGGSIRIHSEDLQRDVFKNILKVPVEEFSHLLRGLSSGCPPHGGIALGFDRLMAVLCQSSSVREVIAFPKSYQSKDLLTGAPSSLDKQTLATYHIIPKNN
ncbi:aspartate--tRNA ligase, mitochondrial-like [Halichondria panicea]|uniref:aspartate--tRNA ligase, mitochondrial-like n=1 Tax=Halichondria panicea TaxID=6063 RepID=UPI00312B4E75